MATIRQLKKEVDQLTFALIEDCIARYTLKNGEEENVKKLVQETIQKRQEVRKQINGHKKIASYKEKRAYINGLVKEFLEETHGRFEQLSQIIQK
ncbi:MAG: hypothetical protein LBI96_03520 [Odoribacteraceae bacterium]|jgi:ferritin|nr:hypothetical protein [Odoribacteraceae bacterium]